MNKKITMILTSVFFFLCFSNIVCARDFIDYKNDIAFDIKESYELIKSDEKLYGFQNDDYKIVYSVIDNGQITDELPFKSFDDITDKEIKSTVNNIGFNPLDSKIEIFGTLDFSKVAVFTGKSGESTSCKYVFYKNNKFYIFQIVSMNNENETKDIFKLEMQMLTTSIKEYAKNDGKKNFYYEKVKKNSNKGKNEDSNTIEIIESAGEVAEDYKPVIKVVFAYLASVLHVNVSVIVYIIGNIIAIILLRKFAIIFEYSYIKYPVGIVLGYFGYKVCENFFFSMDYEMNKFVVIMCITIILCCALIPKKHKKKKSIVENKKEDKKE